LSEFFRADTIFMEFFLLSKLSCKYFFYFFATCLKGYEIFWQMLTYFYYGVSLSLKPSLGSISESLEILGSYSSVFLSSFSPFSTIFGSSFCIYCGTWILYILLSYAWSLILIMLYVVVANLSFVDPYSELLFLFVALY
jgi:hypothetical protein